MKLTVRIWKSLSGLVPVSTCMQTNSETSRRLRLGRSPSPSPNKAPHARWQAPDSSRLYLGCCYSSGRPEFQINCVSAPRIDAVEVESQCAAVVLLISTACAEGGNFEHRLLTPPRGQKEHLGRNRCSFRLLNVLNVTEQVLQMSVYLLLRTSRA
jgi:hypothetical protein